MYEADLNENQVMTYSLNSEYYRDLRSRSSVGYRLRLKSRIVQDYHEVFLQRAAGSQYRELFIQATIYSDRLKMQKKLNSQKDYTEEEGHLNDFSERLLEIQNAEYPSWSNQKIKLLDAIRNELTELNIYPFKKIELLRKLYFDYYSEIYYVGKSYHCFLGKKKKEEISNTISELKADLLEKAPDISESIKDLFAKSELEAFTFGIQAAQDRRRFGQTPENIGLSGRGNPISSMRPAQQEHKATLIDLVEREPSLDERCATINKVAGGVLCAFGAAFLSAAILTAPSILPGFVLGCLGIALVAIGANLLVKPTKPVARPVEKKFSYIFNRIYPGASWLSASPTDS